MTQVMSSCAFCTACMTPTIVTHAQNEPPPPPPTKQQSCSPPPLLSSQTLVLQKRGNPLQESAMSTTPVRETRSPHSGYHFDGSSREFFEGWYFKVSIPEVKQSFAWMYVSENAGTAGSSEREGGARGPSSAAQIMGANDEYLFQDQPSVKSFWGHRHELALGNTFRAKSGALPPVSETSPTEFWELVEEGYQATPTLHQGILFDNGGTDFAKTVQHAKWEYTTVPVYGWGDKGGTQKATAGWLAALPVFEPHWQICMAAGLSTGWIEWGDQRFEFKDAPSYCEKNWGGSFPKKWFWVQCNVFEGTFKDVALTAGGGRRGLPFFKNTFEDVALVCVHFEGKFYEFVPWKGSVDWEMAPWGSWKMSASTKTHEVKLEATSSEPGCTLRAPAANVGMVPLCKDTFFGKLRLRMWERTEKGDQGRMILDTTSDMCALEIGGSPWESMWEGKSCMKQPLKGLLQLPINPEKIFAYAPYFKPPGL
ncbi:unnamed protein product [Sphagnum jensenii]|uniref:Tocopherol cyclase n=1 Tax=Sphagnum jensenii TaxID=128206 RepID=A0ABP1C383_9BRYO